MTARARRPARLRQLLGALRRAGLRSHTTPGDTADVRALEVTHGRAHGWHPHLHVLLFFEPGTPPSAARAMYHFFIRGRRMEAVVRFGGDCAPEAQNFVPVSGAEGAARYVSKWGAARELTHAHVKRGRRGRSPFEILADWAERGDPPDAVLFRDFAEGFKGARQLTWGGVVRQRYGCARSASDAELAADAGDAEPAEVALELQRELWRDIVPRGPTADVLLAADAGGPAEVMAALLRRGLPTGMIHVPGRRRGEYVPLPVVLRPP